MKQFQTQIEGQISEQKWKWSWKKIAVLAGAGALLITGTGLITWAVVKEYLYQKTGKQVKLIPPLPELAYQSMNIEQFNQIHEKFRAIKNIYIKKLATEQLMFYLPTTDFQEIKTEISSSNYQINSSFDLTPNLSKLLTEKMINTVGSNLRVWGLNTGYAFDPKLTRIHFNLNSWKLNGDKDITFDLDLGYVDSTETFKVKGDLKDSEGITEPIVDFTTKNLAKIFQQANNLFNNELNRNGYFIGLDFNGKKGPDNKNPEKAFEWLGDQTVNLQEFNSQTWDYTLNSLKNFNLVKEDVFVNGLKLFKVDGWNPDKIYVKDKTKVKVDEAKNEVWLGKENSFGPHTIVSKIMVTYKTDENINFEFTGSYLQNNQWGNY